MSDYSTHKCQFHLAPLSESLLKITKIYGLSKVTHSMPSLKCESLKKYINPFLLLFKKSVFC